METRRLGRTGHSSSVAVLGAAALWQTTPDVAEQFLQSALDAGVNHLDIAPSYGDAERLIGPLLPAVRDRLFVGCKTMEPTADGARAEMERSLSLLGCSAFDLYQVHAVTGRTDLASRAGAFEAAFRARDEGLCRFVGVTGHGFGTLRAQAQALEQYDLDTVMFPVAPRLWANSGYREQAEALLALAAERDVGVLVIKAASARPKEEGSDATTWYEPYRTPEEIGRGVHFALSVPGVHAFCTPGDVRLLPIALDAAQRFTPMSADERDAASNSVREEALFF